MEMNPGALPHPGRVPKQEILVPQILLVMAAEIGIASGEKGSGIRVSSAGVKIGPKGGTKGGPSHPGGLVARPPPRPRGQAAWVTGGPPPALLRASGVFWNADFLYIFPGIFLAL